MMPWIKKALSWSLFLAIAACPIPAAAAEALPHWEFAGWYGGGCYPNIHSDPHRANRWYLVSDVAGIWKSDDRGEHWRFINKGLGSLTVAFLAIAPSDSERLYAGTKGGLYVSRNAGETWSLCDTYEGKIFFSRPHNHRSIAVSQNNASTLVIGTASGLVLYSEDAGSHWKPLGRSEKPFFQDLPITALGWVDQEKYLYASSEKGVAKYSFENQRWEFLTDAPHPVTDILIAEDSPSKIYAAGGRSLSISMDAGRTWSDRSALPRGMTHRLALGLPASGDGVRKLWVAWQEGWRGGVVWSKDDGKSWLNGDQKMHSDRTANPTRTWAGPASRINALAVDPFTPGVLFRTDWWGVWRSDDDGLNWHEKIVGAPNAVTMDLAVGPSGEVYAASMDNGLVKSVDGGRSYHTIYPSKKYDAGINGHVWRVLILPKDRLLGTASPWYGGRDQVFIAEPDGKFTVLRDGLPEKRPRRATVWEEGYPRALTADPHDPSKLYLGIDGEDGGGLFISEDGGWHWRRSEGQPACLTIYRALAVDVAQSQRIYWGAYSETDRSGGIFVSEDGGQKWKKVFEAMTKVFCLESAADGRLYAGGDDDGPALYGSQDHGAHWTLLKRFSDDGAVTAIAFPDKKPGRIVAGISRWHGREGGLVFLSENAGAEWKDITGDLPESGGSSAFGYDPQTATLYVSRTAGTVYKRKL